MSRYTNLALLEKELQDLFNSKFDDGMDDVYRYNDNTKLLKSINEIENIIRKLKAGMNSNESVSNTHSFNKHITFSISMILDQIEEYGKYQGILMCGTDGKCENYIPVSAAKRIVKNNLDHGVSIFEVLNTFKDQYPEQVILAETPYGAVDMKIGDALIYEGMNGEIVIDSE